MFIDPKRIPNTGNPLVDLGHERLALIINEAYDSWQTGAAPEVWLGLLDTFLEMLAEHFQEEEELAKTNHYAKCQELGKTHSHYLGKLRALLVQFRERNDASPVPADLFENFDRLIYEHELIDDQDLRDAFHANCTPLDKTSELIVWEDTFLVGEKNIDRQHQSLVVLLNRLHEAIVRHDPLDLIVTLLKDIKGHIEWHFSYEEKLMADSAYRGFDSHKALHTHLLDDLNAVVRDVQSRRYEELEELLENYLKFWLLDHILHVDMALGRELNSSMERSTHE